MGNPFSSGSGGGFQGSTMQQGLASFGNAFGPGAGMGMNQGGVSSGQNPLMSLFQRVVGPNGKQVQGDMNDIYDITKGSVAPAPKITPLSLDSPDVNSWGQS